MKILVALTLLITGTAYATGSPPAPEVPDIRSEASAEAKAVGIGLAKAEGGDAVANGGTSTASQNQTQSSVSGAEATNAGNSLSVESHYREMRQAPSSFAPAIYASGPCAYGWSAALSVPGGSVGGGKAKADPACDRREVARVLTPLNPWLALKVLCADPVVKAVATEDDCRYTPPAVSIEPAPASIAQLDLSKYVTRDELVERDRRILKKAAGK